MKRCTVELKIDFDEKITDAASMAVLIDRLIEAARNTLDEEVYNDYGRVIISETQLTDVED